MHTLHYSPTSPYVRKVMVTLHETRQTDTVTLVTGSGTPVAPNAVVTGRNPLGKVPALARDDGCALYDSRVICRYLAECAPEGPALYPRAPRLWESLTLEATADGILDAALLIRYEISLRAESDRSVAWMDGQWAKVIRALDTFEGRWLAHLAGPLCIGQIATGCALGYLDFRFADRDWRSGRPGLSDWFARFDARASMIATRPPM